MVPAALTRPARVAKLVLESTSPGLEDLQERLERTALDDVRADAIRDDFDDFVIKWYEAPLFSSLHRQPRIRERVLARRRLNEAAWVASVISSMSPGRQPSQWGHLKSLGGDVMLISGELDKKYTELALEMGAQIRSARVVSICDAGHNVHIEAPERFVEAAQAFLKS